MTAYRIVEVACDGADGLCNAIADAIGQTFPEARLAARAEGWVCVNGQDFCPDHRVSTHSVVTKTVRVVAHRTIGT